MITIRRMVPDDLVRIAELEKMCFDEPWPADKLMLFCGEGGFGVVAVQEENIPLAYVTVQTAPGEAMIVNVATHPDFRRRGAASLLMREVLRLAKEQKRQTVSLEVRASNTAAQHLYQKLGFSVAGVRRGFYRHPREDAYVMTLMWEG